MSLDFVNLANVVISGLLTGIVYGLMALGLSVIFGVARVVNFAHGEDDGARACIYPCFCFPRYISSSFCLWRPSRWSFYFRLRAVRAVIQSVRYSSRTFAVHLALGHRDHHNE